MAQDTWLGDLHFDYDDAYVWSTGYVPGVNDDAIIPANTECTTYRVVPESHSLTVGANTRVYALSAFEASSFIDMNGDAGDVTLIAPSIYGTGTIEFDNFPPGSIDGTLGQIMPDGSVKATTLTLLANGSDGANTIDGGSAVSQFAGTLGGTGTWQIAGGTYNLDPGAKLTVANLDLSGANVYFGENVTYAGHFGMSDGGIYLGAFGTGPDTHLTLTGPTTFTGGVIVGGGTDSALLLRGNTTLSGYEQVSGNARVYNFGTATELGSLTLGGVGAGGAALVNAKGGIFELVGGASIASAGNPGTVVSNIGTIIKVNDGTSVIKPGVVNSGLIQSFGGTLDVAGLMAGTGTLDVGAGSTMEFDRAVAKTQALSFLGANGTLLLNDAHEFHASVAGFAAGDTIDLAGFSPTGESLQYTNLNLGNLYAGTLSVTSGSHTASLSFLGRYVQSAYETDFHTASDGHGGTLLTFAPIQNAGMITAHG